MEHKVQELTEECKQSVKEKIKYRVQCEKNAHYVVEKLALITIKPEDLVVVAKLITPAHYADITEERSISLMCGYPICEEHLIECKKSFRISTITNMVYDLTERKKYCSGRCFEASDYFAKQIPTIPVWCRQQENFSDIHLLSPHENRGLPGTAVFTDACSSIREELKTIENDTRPINMPTKAQNTSRKMEPELARKENSLFLKDSSIVNSEIVERQTSIELLDDQTSENVRVDISNLISDVDPSEVSCVNSEDALNEDLSLLEKSICIINHWKTDSTLLYLSHKHTNSDDPHQYSECVNRFLNVKEKKHQARFMPTVDTYSQDKLRQKIVMEKLMNYIPKVVDDCSGDIAHELRKLISTFIFTPKNISFKPAEWIHIVLLLVLILNHGRILSEKYASFANNCIVKNFLRTF